MLVTEEKMQAYARQLYLDEKSEATIKKYAATLQDLGEFLNGRDLTKERLLLYRRYLLEKHTAQTVNGALSAIHSFMKYYNCENECVKFLKVQRRPFVDKSKVLSRTEYKRLLDTAKREGKERLYYVMLTLGVLEYELVN